MRNPLRKLFKDRGIPDNCHAHYGNSSSSSTSAVIPIAGPVSTSAGSSALSVNSSATLRPPAGYPNNYGASNNSYSSIIQPPTAYPYTPHQEERESEQVWEINAGNNRNKKGEQRAGNIKAANSATGSSPAINLPRNGRFVFNAGGNCNEGDLQESGNIEFANIG